MSAIIVSVLAARFSTDYERNGARKTYTIRGWIRRVATSEDGITVSEPYLKAFLILGSGLFVLQSLSMDGDEQLLPVAGTVLLGTAALAGGLYYGLVSN